MRTLQTRLCRAGTHTHANKERKLRGDLSVVTLQIVLKKEEKKEKKKKKKKKKKMKRRKRRKRRSRKRMKKNEKD